MAASERSNAPVAFISHNHHDKPVVRQLATALMANGIDVFFDEWEIGPGDSIRRKVDEGLGNCTDFLVILSPHSLLSEWVQSEIDAGFVRKLSKMARFIPLRLGLTVPALPPLLQGMQSPSLDDLEACLPSLINHIHGISQKPALGRAPELATTQRRNTGFSPAAERIAQLLAEKSETGRAGDPGLPPEYLAEETGLSLEDMREAVHELEEQGLVKRLQSLDDGEAGFFEIWPEDRFFAAFDPVFGVGQPAEDALVLGNVILAADEQGLSTWDVSTDLGWPPRRMNPAISYLAARDLIMTISEMGIPWVSGGLYKKPGLRRFVRDGNR